MSDIVIYTTRYCPYCVRAKSLLASKRAPYQEIAVDRDPQLRREMAEKAKSRTVPQIWIGDVHVGGCAQLYALERSGELDALLRSTHDSP